jgi:hypothetical protein
MTSKGLKSGLGESRYFSHRGGGPGSTSRPTTSSGYFCFLLQPRLMPSLTIVSSLSVALSKVSRDNRQQITQTACHVNAVDPANYIYAHDTSLCGGGVAVHDPRRVSNTRSD